MNARLYVIQNETHHTISRQVGRELTAARLLLKSPRTVVKHGRSIVQDCGLFLVLSTTVWQLWGMLPRECLARNRPFEWIGMQDSADPHQNRTRLDSAFISCR